jgi:hypothetical protein
MKTCPACGAVLTGAGDTRPVGRPRKHHVEELRDCLGERVLTSGEFQRRAVETLDISRATFYRLLERGRREWLFRQRLADRKWIAIVSKSQNSAEVTDSLRGQLEGLADAALAAKAQ